MRVTAKSASKAVHAVLQAPPVAAGAKAAELLVGEPRIVVSKYGNGSIRSAVRIVLSIIASVGLVTLPELSVQFTRTTATRGGRTSIKSM